MEAAFAAVTEELGKDYRSYYVDERGADGESVMLAIDGEAHALEFWRLAHRVVGQGHWAWTFVKGGGMWPRVRRGRM